MEGTLQYCPNQALALGHCLSGVFKLASLGTWLGQHAYYYSIPCLLQKLNFSRFISISSEFEQLWATRYVTAYIFLMLMTWHLWRFDPPLASSIHDAFIPVFEFPTIKGKTLTRTSFQILSTAISLVSHVLWIYDNVDAANKICRLCNLRF